MKKLFHIFFVLFVSVELFAQQIPSEYDLGAKRLLKTNDQNPASNTIERILINDNMILLATSDGLSKSTDNGVSWINYGNTVFGTESVSAVGYNNGVIWAATWHMENLLGSDTPVGTGLRYSTDSGSNWHEVTQPVDANSDSTIYYGNNKLRALPITVRPGNFIYDIAFTKNAIWIVSYYGGLRKSTDLGRTWRRVVLPPDNLNSIKPTDVLKFDLSPSSGALGFQNNLNHRAFSILAIDDNTIYVGTAGGINKTTDAGSEFPSWTKFNNTNQSKPISGNFILALEKNDFDNSIWAGTWKAEGQSEFWGASVSRDGGLSWENYLSGERVHDFGFKYFGPLGNYSSANIFTATESGVYRSSNNGTTWISAPEIKDDNSSVNINTKHFLSVKVNNKSDNTSDIWLGSNNGLARLNESDQVTGAWNGTWKVFLASEKLSSATESYAFPNPFSPNSEQVKLKYSTAGSSTVTIRILDFGMNLVRTVIQNASRIPNSEQLDLWDGRDESGRIVPNGVYFYRIDFGSGEPLFGKIMVIM
ncbi:MAG: hypothetical protein NTX65_16650 [Ignavibacteriales bacterium]|nr:hypothetical protein [Ignavibacteriales bacterium]